MIKYFVDTEQRTGHECSTGMLMVYVCKKETVVKLLTFYTVSLTTST